MKKFLIALVAGIALVGCGENDNNDTGIQEGTFPRKITTAYPNSNRSSVTTYNIQNGNLLSVTSIQYKNDAQIGTASIMRVRYEGNRIKQLKHGGPSAGDYTAEDYTYDGQGRMIKETRIESHRTIEGGSSYTQEYCYEGE